VTLFSFRILSFMENSLARLSKTNPAPALPALGRSGNGKYADGRLMLVDNSNVCDLRGSNLDLVIDLVIRSFEHQAHPASNVTPREPT